jgi:hypothetical protein
MSATCLLERYIEDIGMGAIDAVPYPYPIDPELTVFDYDIVKQYIKSLYEPNNNINNNTVINNKKTNRVETVTKYYYYYSYHYYLFLLFEVHQFE